MLRTHTCGELSKEQVGQEVRLAGWVNKRRDHGGFIFIDLRDRYGLTQIAFDQSKTSKKDWAMAEKLRSEFVIGVKGKIIARTEENINPDIKTGEIEIEAAELEIFNEAKTPPFEISDESSKVNEELRLKYRYLDLRRSQLQENITFRAKLVKFIHDYMNKLGYTEIHTPLLTASSPEGARDFLVPSRIHPGKFYALPQAPQQFKQLLMVAGFDKYYQIAPCMRDEDARSDRSPGEFYQLDVECSFKTSEEFFTEQEPIWIELTEKLAGKKVLEKPFPRITYKDAMDKYGSDRPDFRFGLEFHDLGEFAKKTEFSIFKTASVVKGLCVPKGAEKFSRNQIDNDLTDVAKSKGAKGLAYAKVKGADLEGPIAKFFKEEEKAYLIKEFSANDGDILFFVADEYKIVVSSLAAVRELSAEKLELADSNVVSWAWVIDFPMYELNEQTGKIDFMHNPFSMPKGGMDDLENKDPLDIIADQYDIIANGLELSSGAVRNYKPEILYKAFEIAGYSKEDVDKKFKHMIEAFEYGAPPHCGYAPGIDRIMMVLRGEKNIREIIAFPKNSQAQDVMMNAPSDISEHQLKELHIKLDLHK